MAIKIAMIGAGSIGFTRTLMHDTLAVPELRDTTFSFTDISARNLAMMVQLAERDIKANKLPARIIATRNRRQAVADADFVINIARIGGLEGFKLDIDIPLKYGVDQCVGDTLCAGGIMYGQRNIAATLDFCKDIREVAKPGALLMNYANPNAMNTWAANHFGGVNCVGLCHGVQGGHYQIVEVIKRLVNRGRKPGDKGYVEINRDDVDIICAGINHQTWYIKILYRSENWTGRMLEGFAGHPEYKRTEKVRIDILRRFGYFSTESNGHLSEYVAWYRKCPAEIRKWIDLGSWINGETGGYLRVCVEGRNWFETDFPKWLREPSVDIATRQRSLEHGSRIIESIVTGRVYRGHFNVVNNGIISNLPADCIVEAPGFVNRLGINMPQVGALPPGCAAVCNASINVQRLAVLAAVQGDVALLKQAMMMDPLVGAVCTTSAISQMTDEMLVAQAQWLPQYRKSLAAAKKRLASEPRLGTSKSKGAARIPTKPAKPAKPEKNIVDVTAAQATDLLGRPGKIGAAPYPHADMVFHDAGYLPVSRMIDIRKEHGGKDGMVYIKARIKIPRAGAGWFLFGADGPVKAWINGKKIGCHPEATNPAVAEAYKGGVTWKKGLNEVLFALATNNGRAWGVIGRAKHR
jgi:alpha-galactosidase